MKKLLKSVICGTREQYTGALFTVEKSNVAVEKKMKCERTNTDAAFNTIQTGTKYDSNKNDSFFFFFFVQMIG